MQVEKNIQYKNKICKCFIVAFSHAIYILNYLFNYKVRKLIKQIKYIYEIQIYKRKTCDLKETYINIKVYSINE